MSQEDVDRVAKLGDPYYERWLPTIERAAQLRLRYPDRNTVKVDECSADGGDTWAKACVARLEQEGFEAFVRSGFDEGNELNPGWPTLEIHVKLPLNPPTKH